MNTILYRLRGTWSIFAKVHGLALGLLVFWFTGSWVIGLGVTVLYILGESWGWGKWVGSILNNEKVASKARLEEEAKQAKELALATLTVTISNGNTFDGNSDARLNLTNAILASDITGITETNWKLADNSVALVTVDELKEALALAIQEVGRIVGATE